MEVPFSSLRLCNHPRCRIHQLIVAAEINAGIPTRIGNIRTIFNIDSPNTGCPNNIGCCTAAGDVQGAPGIYGGDGRNTAAVDAHPAAGIDGGAARLAAAGDVLPILIFSLTLSLNRYGS